MSSEEAEIERLQAERALKKASAKTQGDVSLSSKRAQMDSDVYGGGSRRSDYLTELPDDPGMDVDDSEEQSSRLLDSCEFALQWLLLQDHTLTMML